MVRQCAWCLRLIDGVGKCTSLLPLPKIYEATHGMCQVCGLAWLEAVGDCHSVAMIGTQFEDSRQYTQHSTAVL